MAKLISINLREVNQQFSELVRRVEAIGRGYLVLRHAHPVARLLPTEERTEWPTPEQRAALSRLLTTSWPFGIERFGASRAAVAGRFSYWDALLLATLGRAGCTTVLSEDMDVGGSLDEVRVCNPFVGDRLPDAIERCWAARSRDGTRGAW